MNAVIVMSMNELSLKLILKLGNLVTNIPRRWQFLAAKIVGNVSFIVFKRRSKIIAKNIAWCFAHESKSQQQIILQENIRFLGLSFFDTGIAWYWPDSSIKTHVAHKVIGLDVLLEAQKNSKKGILLLGKHSQHIELDARVLSLYLTGYGVARGSDSPALNAAMTQGRQKSSIEMSAKNNPRQFVKWLKEGKTVAYFPDQDYGRKRSIETTLLGVPATFTTAPYTLHKLSGCLIFYYNTYYDQQTLMVEIQQLHLPSDNEIVFTKALAAIIEQSIKKHPAEYLWAHRRFKSTKGKESYGKCYANTSGSSSHS